MTIPQEHQSLSIEIGPIGRGGGRTKKHHSSHTDATTERLPRATVAMPTVTLPTTHRNSRHATYSYHSTNHCCSSSSSGSCCSMVRLSRLTFLGLTIFYANELSSSFTFFRPMVRSTPHVKGDYSSIRGVHDLQSSPVRPKCFVSGWLCFLFCSFPCPIRCTKNVVVPANILGHPSSTDCFPYSCRAEFPIAHVQTHSLPKTEDHQYGCKLMR